MGRWDARLASWQSEYAVPTALTGLMARLPSTAVLG